MPVSDVEGHGARLTRVEGEVEAIRGDLGGIKTNMTKLETSMRGLGDILQRIEQNVAQAQDRHDHEKMASRLNPIAFASILITIITILVGGAWTISGQLAREDERSQVQMHQIELIEFRQWQARGQSGVPAEAPAQQH